MTLSTLPNFEERLKSECEIETKATEVGTNETFPRSSTHIHSVASFGITLLWKKKLIPGPRQSGTTSWMTGPHSVRRALDSVDPVPRLLTLCITLPWMPWIPWSTGPSTCNVTLTKALRKSRSLEFFSDVVCLFSLSFFFTVLAG